jgi:phage pi2 protein 07
MPTKNVYFSDEAYQEASFIASRAEKDLNEIFKEAFYEGLKVLRKKYIEVKN